VADFNGVVVPYEPDEDEALGTFDSKSGAVVSPPVQGCLQRVTLRRAFVSGAYVYFTGDTPPGAADIVIISETYV
jgi:hypothetical protein